MRTYSRGAQGVVFEAHGGAFALFKGACRRGIYDTMKSAVETILVDEQTTRHSRLLGFVLPVYMH